MDLVIATGNKHKVDEISKILKKYSISMLQENLPNIYEPDLGSIEKISLEKAKQAYDRLKVPLIAEDTGIYFDYYNDFPGVFAKRIYLGIGFEGLLLLIKNAGDKGAVFKTAISYYDGKVSKTFSGALKGSLLEETVSLEKDRLPYEKLFVPNGYSQALVDIPLEEKNKISHRAKAAEKLGKWLSKK